MNYALSSITWAAPRPADGSCVGSIVEGLEYEIGRLNGSASPVPGDFYYWGGALSAVGRLAYVFFVSLVGLECGLIGGVG